MKRKCLLCVMPGLMFAGCLDMGCKVAGTREVTITIAGTEWGVKDAVTAGPLNDDGVPEYTITFVTEGWKALSEWFFPAKPEPPDDAEPPE